jgi:outer membrane immunogenic protein
MKKFLLSAACLLGMAISASAADLAARPYTKAPVMVADVYNWTGFYIGGNVGYSWGRSEDTSTLANGAGTVLFTSFDSTNLDGIVGGGQIGYNWQSQSLVWGLEADIQGTDEKGSRAFTCPTGICTPFVPNVFNGIAVPFAQIQIGTPGPAVPVSLNQSLDWFGTARGRIGFLVSPRILFYGTGGLAYGEVKSSGTVASLGGFSSTNTKAGYSIGAGIEGVISGNWTAKLEYLYVDLGRMSGSFTTTTGALGGGTLVSSYSSRITDNILRVGLNYKLGGLGGR